MELNKRILCKLLINSWIRIGLVGLRLDNLNPVDVIEIMTPTPLKTYLN